MGTPIDPPLQGPILRPIELTQKAPECFTNDGGTEPVGNLARDQCNQTLKGEWPTHPPTNTIWCCPHQGLFFVCGTDAYLCLPVNWMGICTLAFLTPQMNIVPNNQTLTVPLAAHMESKRAIQFIPLLASLGITAGIGMGIGGIASSATFYHTLSKDFTDDIEREAKSLVALQDQLDSLAEVVLQNRRGLDLLTAEKRGLCLFLNEECCFYVNQSGIVRDMAQQLREQIIKRREELANSWGNWNNIWSWASWLLPLTGPLFMFFVVLLFGPCILNAITQFITSWIESIKLQMVIAQYSPLNDGEL